MPYTELTPENDTWRRLMKRALISGPPNSGKSFSSRTFPRPIAIVSPPGELGVVSLPIGEEGVTVFAQTEIDMSKPTDWVGIVEETRRLMADLCTKNVYQTIFFDGLHKLEFCYLNMETGGALARGDMNFQGMKVYPAVKHRLLGDIRRWIQSPVPYIIFTVWIGRDKEDPGLDSKSPTHIFPALAGQTGQEIVGEFTLCLYAERQGYGQAARYLWQTQADPKVWGAGCKLREDLAKKLPATVPQDWAVLEKYLTT